MRVDGWLLGAVGAAALLLAFMAVLSALETAVINARLSRLSPAAEGEVGAAVPTDNSCLDGCRGTGHQNGVGILDHMIGGQHQVVGPDDAGGRPPPACLDPDDAGSQTRDQLSNLARKIGKRCHTPDAIGSTEPRLHPDGRDRPSPFD